jgi:uncharacterized protein (TIGR02145 family)
MNTREVYLLTIAGWKNIRIEPGSVRIYNNQVAGTEIEITAVIGSKEISYDSGYSPVRAVPEVAPAIGYCEVTIGTQVWMCLNWDANYPGSKVYDNDEANRALYGGLYTHDQVMSPGFCPAGYHVPTIAEWLTLINFVGGQAVAGGVLKEAGTTYWLAPNTGAVNTFGFGMRSTGQASPEGAFNYLFQYATLWAIDGLILFSSTNAGVVWSLIISGFYYGVRLLNNNSAPLSFILAGTSNGALILKSVNEGISFTNQGTKGVGNPSCFFKLIADDPGGGFVNNNVGDVYYGTDAGHIVNYSKGTERDMGVITTVNCMIQVPIAGDVYYGCSDGKVYHHGFAWNVDFNLGGSVNEMFYDASADSIIFITAAGIFKAALVQAGNFTCGCDAGGGILYAGDTAGHLWKSVDYGDNWADLGLVAAGGFTKLIISGSRLLFTYAAVSSIGYTDNEGASHTFVNTGADIPITLLRTSVNTLLAGTSSGHIYRSINNGSSWSEIAGNPQQGEASINCLIKT